MTYCLERIQCTTKTLVMEMDEAIATTRNQATETVVTVRVPYANIESIEATTTCGCCNVLSAGDLTRVSCAWALEDLSLIATAVSQLKHIKGVRSYTYVLNKQVCVC